MSDHISTTQMERFCARTLPVSELTITVQHLASCKACHQLFQETQERRRNYAPVSFTLAPEKWLQHEHLTYEQLAPYVENRLNGDEHELLDLHLQLCGECREDVRSFQLSRQQAETETKNVHPFIVQPTLREKLLSRWNWLTTGWRPVYATAVVIILISSVILVALLSERNRTSNEQARQLQSRQSSEAVTEPSVNSSNLPTQANGNSETIAVSPATKTNSANKFENSSRSNTTRSTSPVQKVLPEPNRPSIDQTVALNDGQERVFVGSSGQLTGLNNLPTETQATIKGVLLARNIERPAALQEIEGETSGLRGAASGSPSFKLLSPTRTVIANDRPTFNWTQVAGATSYRVQVVDSHNLEVANSGELTSTEWTLTKPLARGIVYTWVVTAVVNGQEVIAPSASEPEMKFKVLDEKTLQEIKALQQRTRSHLAFGILYARAGMRAEAEREFQMLVKQNPNSSIAQQLLRTIQSWQ